MPPRKSFHQDEDAAILQGIQTYGEGSWAKIKASNPVLKERTGVQIKDRFRNMLKKDPDLLVKLSSGNPVTPGSSAKKEAGGVTHVDLFSFAPAAPVESPAAVQNTLPSSVEPLPVVEVVAEEEPSTHVISFELTAKALSGVLYEIGVVEKKVPNLFDLCYVLKECVRNLMRMINSCNSNEEMPAEKIFDILGDSNITLESSKGMCDNITACVDAMSAHSGADPLPNMSVFKSIMEKVYGGDSLEQCKKNCKGCKLSASVVQSKNGIVRPGKPDIALKYEVPKPKNKMKKVVKDATAEAKVKSKQPKIKSAASSESKSTPSKSPSKKKEISVNLVTSPAKRSVSFAADPNQPEQPKKRTKKPKKKPKKMELAQKTEGEPTISKPKANPNSNL